MPSIAEVNSPAVWPLVGRQDELRLCESVVTENGSSGIVLVGAPGVGKTRLVSEALAAAARSGRVVARVTATEAGRTIPLGALAHLLPADLPRVPTTFDVLRRAEIAFAQRSRQQTLVLGVDDAHLLDSASAMLVHQLLADGSAVGLLTVRSGEPAPDAVTALWKDDGCLFVELEPLSRGETGGLLESVLGGQVEGRTERLLWEASQGVPLVLRELVLEGLHRDLLVQEGSVWCWHGDLALGRRLRELVAARIGDVDEVAREGLELVALGEPLPFSWLPDPDVVDSFVRRGLLRAARDGRRVELRFAHPVHGDVVRSEIPATRATLLQRQLGDMLESTGIRRNGDLLRLAVWRLEGGGAASTDLFVAAARRAELSFAPALAERLARAAVAGGGGLEARFVLASALTAQGRADEAGELLAILSKQATTDTERALIAEARARLLAGPLGRATDAAAVIASAREVVADRSARARLALADSWLLGRLGGPAQAVGALLESVQDERVEPHLRASAASWCVNMLAQMGRPLEAVALADRFVPPDHPRLRAEAACARSVAVLLAGQLALAEASALELYETEVELGDVEWIGLAAWWCGQVVSFRGRLHDARRFLHEAVELMRKVDPQGMLPWAFSLLAQIAGELGEAREASANLAEAEAAAAPGSWVYAPSIELARAWTNAAMGALSEARQSALVATDLCIERGQLGSAFLLAHDLVRLGGSEDAEPRLADLAGRVEGDWVRACADHAAALVDCDAIALCGVAGRFEELGLPVEAAESYSEAAKTFRSEGRMSSARSCAARARAIVERCPGIRTPALLAIDQFDDLTPREREVASLAASGLSNKAIAARLVVSVRTVENQLQRAYRKLGITTRAELARVFGLAKVE